MTNSAVRHGDREVRDLLEVVAVEGVGDAQDGGHLGDGDPAVAVEGRVFGVARAGSGAPVVARDQGDERHVLAGQPEQVAVLDEVHRVLVVAPVADEAADLVKQRRDPEQQFVPRVEMEFVPEGPEEPDAHVRDESGVLLVDGVFLPRAMACRTTSSANASVQARSAAISWSSPSRKLVLGIRIALDLERPRTG